MTCQDCSLCQYFSEEVRSQFIHGKSSQCGVVTDQMDSYGWEDPTISPCGRKQTNPKKANNAVKTLSPGVHVCARYLQEDTRPGYFLK